MSLGPRRPAIITRHDQAPPPRTLVDILYATAAEHPRAAAIDDGTALTYAELIAAVEARAAELRGAGVTPGSRVGIRMSSGTAGLYINILAILLAGAAYVPVDADDPEERAELVFSEAEVAAIINDAGITQVLPAGDAPGWGAPGAVTGDMDAWIIFTSGSTGVPKGVAVTHRSAAAFVDAEAEMFPAIGPGDRVLAGLSVAFDASCEEMWLAWRNGACLVPAPRQLVRSGQDLGPWLISRAISVISTVPTLAALWPDEALESVRLLIFGGEACPAELVERLATPDREVWNTYGPTEATVVACGARMLPGAPVTIGFPLAGWDLAVVSETGEPVAFGEPGELIIGGVGLARYLDREKDRTVYAPSPQLGWARAYRTGDHVRMEEDGIHFIGRVDDQVKIGGRRIELGEVTASVQALPGVNAAAVVVQKQGGRSVLVGYYSMHEGAKLAPEDAAALLKQRMPAALVPRLCQLDELPVTTSGKVDKKSLPWPLPGTGVTAEGLTETQAWIAGIWVDALGTSVASADDDFFDLGGSSLAASATIAQLRSRYPYLSVRDLYDHPRLGALANYLDGLGVGVGAAGSGSGAGTDVATVSRIPFATHLFQLLSQFPLGALRALPWLGWLTLLNNLAAVLADHYPGLLGRLPGPVTTSWPLCLLIVALCCTPLGRLPLAALCVRLLNRRIQPGTYPRGGKVHYKIWLAERITHSLGVARPGNAPFMPWYARAIGCKIGRDVTAHTLPPVLGNLTLGDGAAIEPETMIPGYTLTGTQVTVGPVKVGKHSRIGARSVLLPGAEIGARVTVEPGSCVAAQTLPTDSRWAGSPAQKKGRHRHTMPTDFPQVPRGARARYAVVYAGAAALVELLPILAVGFGAAAALLVLAVFGVGRLGLAGAGGVWLAASIVGVVGTGAYLLAYAALILGIVRGCNRLLRPTPVPLYSPGGVALWMTTRILDDARHHLFPLYSSLLTPLWFRLLGAKVGREVEISTTIGIPKFMRIKKGSFLADDTMVAGYQLGRGWIASAPVTIGKRSFLGNSAMAAPGRRLAKDSLVAVLSQVPRRTTRNSNWWGSPPQRLRRQVGAHDAAESRTYQPPRRLKIARAAIETLRLFSPLANTWLLLGCLGVLQYLAATQGRGWAWAAAPAVFVAAGLAAGVLAVAAKWLCVGGIGPADHPLWSPFIWLNELHDTFLEHVAAPWLMDHIYGTAALNALLRALGANIGRDVWLDTYWLPEADQVRIGDGATVGAGVVLQTHLFHDRVMGVGPVVVGPGASVGAHSVILPGATVGAHASVGPASLVMRGDQLPAGTHWQGNPVRAAG